MAFGPGKYDDLASLVRKRTEAQVVIVMVMGGNRGTGFSVQMLDPRFAPVLPELLETVARQIADTNAGL